MPAKKRELLDTGSAKRYVRRDDQGRVTDDQVDVGRSLVTDRQHKSKNDAAPGQGDTGDHKE